MPETRNIDYEVLARKYRPGTFSELIGQDAMVRTLRNAFSADRVAHAFIMTGVRGVGKTTAARIIAKGLNCIGEDGKGSPTTEPCGKCEHCRSISEGSHIDVIEMDAASNTSVNDVREIIDSIQYKSASARFKVYVVDEVHMLSNSAFNALLKTLEEPPSHVKFIFATTEIRKVPVTVLSRCQRFDLRRIDPLEMIAHLKKISGLESVDVSDEALALITRAAEGSVRDAVSLLDQAVSMGSGKIDERQVREMMGLADRLRILDLFDLIMKGDARSALRELADQYRDGADPVAVLRELAETTHWISVAKHFPEAAEDPTVGPEFRTRAKTMADALPTRVTARAWQMLLAALDEVSCAPNSMMAAEMAVIRLTHVSELPTPDELVKRLDKENSGIGSAGKTAGTSTASVAAPAAREPADSSSVALSEDSIGASEDVPHAAGSRLSNGIESGEPAVEPPSLPDRPGSIEDLLSIIERAGAGRLEKECREFIKSTDFSGDEILISLRSGCRAELRTDLDEVLGKLKIDSCRIEVQNNAADHGDRNPPIESGSDTGMKYSDHPIVRSVLEVFPGATVRLRGASQRVPSLGITDFGRPGPLGAFR